MLGPKALAARRPDANSLPVAAAPDAYSLPVAAAPDPNTLPVAAAAFLALFFKVLRGTAFAAAVLFLTL